MTELQSNPVPDTTKINGASATTSQGPHPVGIARDVANAASLVPTYSEAMAVASRRFYHGELSKYGRVATNHPVVRHLQDILERIHKNAGEFAIPGACPSLTLFMRGEEANAFALPDGRICIWPKLLSILRTTDEWAALIAHEYVHIQREHSRKLEGAKNLKFVGLGRIAEKEGDIIAMNGLLGNAGFSPGAIISLLESIENNLGDGWDLEHGSTSDRRLDAESIFPLIHIRFSERPEQRLPSEIELALKEITNHKAEPRSTAQDSSDEAAIKTFQRTKLRADLFAKSRKPEDLEQALHYAGQALHRLKRDFDAVCSQADASALSNETVTTFRRKTIQIVFDVLSQLVKAQSQEEKIPLSPRQQDYLAALWLSAETEVNLFKKLDKWDRSLIDVLGLKNCEGQDLAESLIEQSLTDLDNDNSAIVTLTNVYTPELARLAKPAMFCLQIDEPLHAVTWIARGTGCYDGEGEGAEEVKGGLRAARFLEDYKHLQKCYPAEGTGQEDSGASGAGADNSEFVNIEIAGILFDILAEQHAGATAEISLVDLVPDLHALCKLGRTGLNLAMIVATRMEFTRDDENRKVVTSLVLDVGDQGVFKSIAELPDIVRLRFGSEFSWRNLDSVEGTKTVENELSDHPLKVKENETQYWLSNPDRLRRALEASAGTLSKSDEDGFDWDWLVWSARLKLEKFPNDVAARVQTRELFNVLNDFTELHTLASHYQDVIGWFGSYREEIELLYAFAERRTGGNFRVLLEQIISYDEMVGLDGPDSLKYSWEERFAWRVHCLLFDELRRINETPDANERLAALVTFWRETTICTPGYLNNYIERMYQIYLDTYAASWSRGVGGDARAEEAARTRAAETILASRRLLESLAEDLAPIAKSAEEFYALSFLVPDFDTAARVQEHAGKLLAQSNDYAQLKSQLLDDPKHRIPIWTSATRQLCERTAQRGLELEETYEGLIDRCHQEGAAFGKLVLLDGYLQLCLDDPGRLLLAGLKTPGSIT